MKGMITNNKKKKKKKNRPYISRQLSMCFRYGQHAKNNVIIISTKGSTCIWLSSVVTKFLVTCSLILHTRSKFVTLWVNSITTGNFTHSIKGKLSILSRNRCYGLRPLMTSLYEHQCKWKEKKKKASNLEIQSTSILCVQLSISLVYLLFPLYIQFLQ